MQNGFYELPKSVAIGRIWQSEYGLVKIWKFLQRSVNSYNKCSKDTNCLFSAKNFFISLQYFHPIFYFFNLNFKWSVKKCFRRKWYPSVNKLRNIFVSFLLFRVISQKLHFSLYQGAWKISHLPRFYHEQLKHESEASKKTNQMLSHIQEGKINMRKSDLCVALHACLALNINWFICLLRKMNGFCLFRESLVAHKQAFICVRFFILMKAHCDFLLFCVRWKFFDKRC